MDVSSSKYLEAPPPLFSSHQMEARLEGKHGNPFLETFADPICRLNLKETSEFVKSLPASHMRSSVTKKSVEAPSTPGRPIFRFSVGNFSRKSVPSKWDDAEKWVVNGHDSPAHNHGFKSSKYCNGVKPNEAAEKSRIEEDEKLSKATNGVSDTTDMLLKDKFTKERSFFGNVREKAMNSITSEVKQRDIGTEMTPIGSRCHTPIKTLSPPGHNTPADRSGPLPPLTSSSASTLDIMQLQECHLAKLQLGTMKYDFVASNWSSREEEEEDVSKSLRHFEAFKPGTCPWEEEVAKCCLRYQSEKAQIQAWVNLQSAKAEAQSKKLEVKIEKMRSKKEEKLMKKMAMVHRKAEELRIAAQLQHSEQMQKVSERAKKMVNRHKINVFPHPTSCTCFPCNSHHV